jgi:hypothetical protein
MESARNASSQKNFTPLNNSLSVLSASRDLTYSMVSFACDSGIVEGLTTATIRIGGDGEFEKKW